MKEKDVISNHVKIKCHFFFLHKAPPAWSMYMFSPATFLCLIQARTWISNSNYMVFLFVFGEFSEVVGCFVDVIGFCWQSLLVFHFIINKGNAKRGVSPHLKIWSGDLDLWPWKSIGFQILLKTKYVPSLVKIHWRMLILVFTRMLRKDGR